MRDTCYEQAESIAARRGLQEGIAAGDGDADAFFGSVVDVPLKRDCLRVRVADAPLTVAHTGELQFLEGRWVASLTVRTAINVDALLHANLVYRGREADLHARCVRRDAGNGCGKLKISLLLTRCCVHDLHTRDARLEISDGGLEQSAGGSERQQGAQSDDRTSDVRRSRAVT